MRRWACCVLPLALFAASLAGCGLDEFDDTITDQTTIPAPTPGIPFLLPGFSGGLTDIDLKQSQSFKNNDVEPGDVDAIFVTSIRLDGSTGTQIAESDRLDKYLSAVRFFVEAPGQERKLLGEKAVLAAASSAELDVVSDFNLKPYAVAPSMSVSAEATVAGDRPPFNMKITITVSLHVDINLLGN